MKVSYPIHFLIDVIHFRYVIWTCCHANFDCPSEIDFYVIHCVNDATRFHCDSLNAKLICCRTLNDLLKEFYDDLLEFLLKLLELTLRRTPGT
jgi:hypothetical protein